MKESKILQQVEEKRNSEGLSQGEIAKILGSSRKSYNQWIHGKHEPNREKLIDMFTYLTGKKTLIIKNDREDPEYLTTPAEWIVGEE